MHQHLQIGMAITFLSTKSKTYVPLVDPTARVAPSDMKSTDVKGDSAVITFTDLNTSI